MRHAQASKPRRGARHSLSIGLVAIGCTLAIAACASSGKASNSVRRNAFLAFSRKFLRVWPDPQCFWGSAFVLLVGCSQSYTLVLSG